MHPSRVRTVIAMLSLIAAMFIPVAWVLLGDAESALSSLSSGEPMSDGGFLPLSISFLFFGLFLSIIIPDYD